MFNLTKTFKNEAFEITPILMGDTVIFLPNELNNQLGYADLANSIRTSKGAIEGVDYLTISGDNLRSLKELAHGRGGTTPVVISQNASSLLVLTESGLWWTMFNSIKPDCIKLRTWVTSEVLPSIRKTGSYQIPQQRSAMELAAASFKAWGEMALACQTPKHIQMIEITKYIEKEYGIPATKLLEGSPVMDNIKENELFLEPTELGKMLNMSAIFFNKMLQDWGWQYKVGTQWTPTSVVKDSTYFIKHAWSKQGKSGYNLKWNVKLVVEKHTNKN